MYLALVPFVALFRCKNMEVPLDKVYNKSQRDKFAWAVHMTEKDFDFWGMKHSPG